ncbi:MAG: hypothetical protein JSS97_19640 [Actinobacteria bacterium]|nr:hypothetical protein [Actinomycetota bacterium]
MKRPALKRPSIPPDQRIPRGAIVIVVVGLLATLAAALLSTGKGSGEAARLEFVQQRAMAASEAVAVPGAKEGQKLELLAGKIQATGTNAGGYSLFRVLSTLKIDKGAPVSKGRVTCSIHALGAGTLIGQSSNGLRTLYPRSSEDGIYGQPVPETILVEFSSHGSELAVLEVAEGLPERFTTIKGVKLSWPKYEVGTEHLEYFLPEGIPKSTIELPFYAVWRGTVPPAAKVSCRLEVAKGKVTVNTAGKLPIPPPINEEAEAEAQEEREATEEKSGE